MKKITLINSFHNTEAALIPRPVTEGRFAGKDKISHRTVQRVRRELCGIAGCVCGGDFGERGGPHIHVINEDYDRNYIISGVD